MENSSRNSRASQPSSSGPLKQRRSGYEPSDTETDWQETPLHDRNWKNGGFGEPKTVTPRNASPLKHNVSQRNASPLKKTVSPISTSPLKRTVSPISTCPLTVNTRLASSSPPKGSVACPLRRRHSKSPYKPRRDDGNVLPPAPGSDFRRNISPLSKSERRRNISPYKAGREEHNLDKDEPESSNRKQNQRTHNREEKGAHSQLPEDSRASEKSNYSRRSATAPRLRAREIDQQNRNGNIEQRGERTPSPLSRNMIRKQREASNMKAPSIGEINEMVAIAKLSGVPSSKAPNFESTDSISPGDIFFSRDCTALAMQNNVLPKNNGFESLFNSKPKMLSERDYVPVPPQSIKLNGSYGHNARGISSSNGSSRTTTTSSSAISRQFSIESSKMSDGSGRTTQSMKQFTANRRKNQTEAAWFACMRKGACRTSKSPEPRQPFDEVSFIEKAFVVEHLRQFWADKHQPGSLNGFTCHKQEAQILKQLVSHDICPHILFKGPCGSGKKALTMALLREIYGDQSWNISHDLRYFQIQEKRPKQVVIPLTSSAHHVELNVNSEPNARYALMALVKEISDNFAITPEVSTVNFKADYKVIVLYEVDKAAENIQHLIKWIMDCYTDACKLVLCCEDDVEILESVKTRCKVIKVDAPVTHEIMEVLIQIARKEDIDLSMSFAAKIATKSKQNLRKAIMALEACKAHNYPFVDDQPIPLGWEEVLVELAAEILVDPSPKRLFFIRGKFQKLLVDFVHPKLILQKLVEQFLKGVEANMKRELYYWHAYYDKRLPTGTSALLKLEEFVAKFMSIYRKSFSNRQYT